MMLLPLQLFSLRRNSFRLSRLILRMCASTSSVVSEEESAQSETDDSLTNLDPVEGDLSPL